MSNIGNPPCDVGVIRSHRAGAPCEQTSRPWVLAATIIGSAMAFIDSTVTNVALPQIQDRLGATATDAQWIVESYALFLSALIQVHGYSATAAGSSFLPFTIITFVMSRWAGGLVIRFGARLPLMIGPVIAAAGFVLFALPGIGGSYWTTFFPAIVVLGLGMALVIAPLTTTAMNTVSGSHSGLASGVNNAVSRTAGLLAIPVLGIFVFLVFSSGLDAGVQNLDLSPQAQEQLEAEKGNLGGAQAPAQVSEGTAVEIERAIQESFLAGFRVAMFIAAGLAVASAVAAAVIIEGKGSTAPGEKAGRTEGETAAA